MIFVLKLLALFVLIALIDSASRDRNNQKYKVVCYWGAWSEYRDGNGKFEAEQANPMICTHMVYGFAKLWPNNNTIGEFEVGLDLGDTDWKSGQPWGLGMYRRFNHLRSYNPHLTTLISIGGWNEGSDKYSHMVSTAASRTAFVNSVIDFLKKYDFDGLDIDWEYPSMKAVADADRKPGVDADKQNYIELLRELHTAFQPHGYVLTAAVSAGKTTIDRAYNVPEMNKYLDIINVMTYDFHGGWENKTGHNAPLHPRPSDTEEDKVLNVEYAINYWIKLGADPKKMVMGIPLYGRTFTLAGADTGINAKAVGAGGAAGKITRIEGMLGYEEICQNLKQSGWKITREPDQKIPYAVNGKQWVGYDDKQSITDKVNFLKSKGLGGAMVWSIDTDDFNGVCGDGKYPLLKTISGLLNGITGPDPKIVEVHITGTPDPNVNPTQAHTDSHKGTTKKPENSDTQTNAPETNGDFKCVSAGYFKDSKDEKAYYDCVDAGNGKFNAILFHCPTGTVFKESKRICDFA